MNCDHNHYRNGSNYYKSNNACRLPKYRDHHDNSPRNESSNNYWRKRYRHDIYKNPKSSNKWLNSTSYENYYDRNNYYNRSYRLPYTQQQQNSDDEIYDSFPRSRSENSHKHFRKEVDQHREIDDGHLTIKSLESNKESEQNRDRVDISKETPKINIKDSIYSHATKEKNEEENLGTPIQKDLPESCASVANEHAKTSSTTNESIEPCKQNESESVKVLPVDIKDLDTTLVESITQKSGPAISLVPLSFLIDPKLQVLKEDANLPSLLFEEPTESSSAVSDLNQNDFCPKSENSNFKKPELISKKLIDKVATMDKTNIRNVINNPILKFDVALKMHAKKRLREEIRKQLRNMTFENRQITGDSTMRPDGYVDPESIPSEVLKQFESVLKMEFECGPETMLSTYGGTSIMTPLLDSCEDNLSDVCEESPNAASKEHMASDSKVSLRTKLLNLEFIKQQTILRRCRPQASESDDDVCIVETPIQNNQILHDESSTDSSATNTTATSNTSCVLPKTMLEEKFLDCFKREILPNLPQNVRYEYENSPGKDGKIWKIYSMCLEKLKTLGQQTDLNKTQFDSSNSDEALNFLIQNVRDLFSVNKNDTCKSDVPKAKKGRPPPATRSKKLEGTNKKKSTNGKRVSTRWDTNTAIVPCQQTEVNNSTMESNQSFQKNENKSTKEPSHRKEEDSNDISVKRNTTARRSKRKASCRSNTEQTDKITRLADKTPVSNSNCQFEQLASNTNCCPDQSITTGPVYNNEKEGDLHLTEFLCRSNTNKRIESDGTDASSSVISIQQSEEIKCTTNNTNDCKVLINERLWRSPGEKKCLESSVNAQLPKIISPHVLETSPNEETAHASTDPVINTQLNTKDELNDKSSIDANSTITSSVGENEENGMNSFDALKTLDTKLMELNQKKMEIEKRIIELQKEKMEIDLTVMQLQNDRFALISSVVSMPNGCFSANPNMQNFLSSINSIELSNTVVDEKPKPKAKKANKKTPAPKTKSDFAEKLKNRKKRCNRDILIEYSASTLFPDSSKEHYEEIRDSDPADITEKVRSMFSMPTRRSQRPVQIVSPEKPKNLNLNSRSPKSSSPPSLSACPLNMPEENLLPVSCVGQSVNITESDCSDYDGEDNDSGHFSDIIPSRPVANGQLKGFRLPIVKMIGIQDYIICASEDGNIYKFDSATRQLISTFSKHTESITEMCVDGQGCVYSTSLDGYMKKTSVENFGLELQSVNLHEPLQAVNLCWDTAFIGSRWGNVFTYDVKKNKLNESLLCSVGSAIIAIKATKEGPRRIIIISSRGETIHFRDAASGLLLRTIYVREHQNISNIALNGGLLYCGSFSNKVFVYDFTTGNEINTFTCGNGAVSLQIFRNKLLFIGCYDGFIYVLDKQSGEQIGRFPGAGKMILALEIVGEKVLTSSKDSAVQIMDIPNYVLSRIK